MKRGWVQSPLGQFFICSSPSILARFCQDLAEINKLEKNSKITIIIDRSNVQLIALLNSVACLEVSLQLLSTTHVVDVEGRDGDGSLERGYSYPDWGREGTSILAGGPLSWPVVPLLRKDLAPETGVPLPMKGPVTRG